MFKRLGRATLRAALIAVAAGAGGAAVAYATIPDSNGVIHGCYLKTSGTLRVIDTGKSQTCSASRETALNWAGRTAILNEQEVITQVHFNAGGLQEVDSPCPAGTTLTGGGAGADNQNVNMIDSNPDFTNNRWQVVYYLGQASTIVARAMCAKINP